MSELAMGRKSQSIDSMEVSVYTVPTDHPEADGTFSWSSTTLVVVDVRSDGSCGLGWTYASPGAATVIREQLMPVVIGADPLHIPRINEEMARACRNLGRTGLVACAISAVDIALWDLKARLLDLSLSGLFGQFSSSAPVYGSGGFITYSESVTRAQVEQWIGEWGIPRVKIKVGESWGAEPARDLARVELVRNMIGDNVELYVDANGAYSRKQAVRMGGAFSEVADVTWFEEPVSSDDLDGLREVRDHCAADVTAGEYGFTLDYFERMAAAGAVDCLQIDVTRCGGYTIWLRAAAVAAAHNLQVSGHCAPNLHTHVATAVPNLRHLEYFHDHHRIEFKLFEGTLSPAGGQLRPDLDRAGHGLDLRREVAEQFRSG